jgi:uncharacterized protein YjbJ (UPF0337 family)
MDPNRIKGSAKQVKGAVKEATGKALRDAKLASGARPTSWKATFKTPSAA